MSDNAADVVSDCFDEEYIYSVLSEESEEFQECEEFDFGEDPYVAVSAA